MEGFSSWSWAGHMVIVHSSIAGPYDAGFSGSIHEDVDIPKAQSDSGWIRKTVAFYKVDKTGTQWYALHSTQIDGADSPDYVESLSRWTSSDLNESLKLTKLGMEQQSIPLDHVLACWTQTVQLLVDRALSKSPSQRGFNKSGAARGNGYTIRNMEGKELGYLPLTKDYREAQPDKLQFILVAEHRRWEKELGPIFQIIHVEEKHGITFRVQIVRDNMITVDIWRSLGAEWKFVALA